MPPLRGRRAATLLAFLPPALAVLSLLPGCERTTEVEIDSDWEAVIPGSLRLRTQADVDAIAGVVMVAMGVNVAADALAALF